ncbi:hypothetical protein GQ44DRAFT_711740 [Phaeosphaeriaceae sp. PMI808]|nr:hypothetical protein GQ44DRAFT_711740 [Phaeosphaeriaceae sp. PMI808]
MFKPTPSLQKMLRRLPLSPKQAGKEYYKGNRVGSMGTINKWGGFKADWSKVRTFVYPVNGTTRSELTPFVSETIEKNTLGNHGYDQYPERFTGEDYLKAWKLAGGYDMVQNGETLSTMPVPFEEKAGAKA